MAQISYKKKTGYRLKQRLIGFLVINRETQREPIIFDLRGAKFVSALRRVSFASATYRKTAAENSSKVEKTVKIYVFGSRFGRSDVYRRN